MNKVLTAVKRSLPFGLFRVLKFPLASTILDAKLKGTVAAGPFQGMRYQPKRNYSGHYAKLLGTYEQQIYPYLTAAIDSNTTGTLVVVGAADGYYAVGLARKYPTAKVVAFEMDAPTQIAIQGLAALNGVAERVEIKGYCALADLKAVVASQPVHFIFMDVEGGEAELANPELIPQLKACTLIIELHPMLVPNVQTLVAKRFEATHTLTLVGENPRTPDDLKGLFQGWQKAVIRRQLSKILSEDRSEPMQWYVLVPK